MSNSVVGVTHIDAAELADYLRLTPMELDDAGAPRTPLVFVHLHDDVPDDLLHAAARAARESTVILVGLAPDGIGRRAARLADALAVTLHTAGSSTRRTVRTDDLEASTSAISTAVTHSPRAAVTLCSLLRVTARLGVADGLVAESLAYSMLLAGPEFARWRASRPATAQLADDHAAVLVSRDHATLHVTMNRPQRHNAIDRGVRDGLADAFDLVLLDDTIVSVQFTGNGPSFCSGGDLDDFGTTPDVATAHLIRLNRSVAARVDRCRDRVHVVLHGACVGAGIEIPSFAADIRARDDAFFQLPELAIGLVPGAGGTVGITRRVGRWRTAFLALTGMRIGIETALDWGLVDGHG